MEILIGGAPASGSGLGLPAGECVLDVPAISFEFCTGRRYKPTRMNIRGPGSAKRLGERIHQPLKGRSSSSVPSGLWVTQIQFQRNACACPRQTVNAQASAELLEALGHVAKSISSLT